MKKLLVVIVLICFPFHLALAVKVSSLYQAEIAVASQASDEREQAIKDGFLQVLMKVSGHAQIEKNPLIHSNLKRAEYYVQEFSYQIPSTSASQYLLQIHYNINDVNRLLKRAGISSWGQNRPLILVWLAFTDKEDTREIIGNEESTMNILDYMKQQAKNTGLPFIFPMMDVEDMNRISVDNVIEKSLPILKDVSKRYAPDALLIGHLQQHDDGFESEWQFVLNGEQWDWSISGITAKHIISSVISEVGQTLSKRYTVKVVDHASPIWLKLEVTNITQRDDLVQLIHYLKQLTPVSQVQLLQVSGNSVKLSVLIQGSLVTFQQHASIGKRLIPSSSESSGNQLVYEWAH
ncbi:MAG: hypothetical protein A3F42_06990 [Gammaproteobacteria bacterium RIFCSPHIGHO2_12_FULL_37_34]|nr:MAG: hypothetical protein A3F42_06990 [Gammaproteobacteria bacterium RIFCSPHIGHO2_12_FULL_37_34]